MKNYYTGFHAVEERIRRAKSEGMGECTFHILYSKAGPRVKKILELAKEAEIPVEQADNKKLDGIASNLNEFARDHRGIILEVVGESQNNSSEIQLDQWLTVDRERSTVVLLDSVTDPHNVGAIIRSCDQFGADLMIVCEHRSSSDIGDSEIIARTSAGSAAWVPVSKVTNLVRAAQQLKEAGYWIYGADAGGQSLQNTEFAPKTCIIMGSEGSGMARLLEEQCDQIVSIPTCGKIDSLNVSVAAGVLLYERYRQSL